MKKTVKRSLAMAIVLTLLLSLALITTALADEPAAAEENTRPEGTIDLHMEVEQYKEQLAASEIELSFYRIGELDDETMTAKAPDQDGAFKDFPIEGLVSSTEKNDVTAELVQQAETIAEENELTPSHTAKLTGGTGVTDIKPGVYLMTAKGWESANRELLYTVKSAILFIPYIYETEVSLKVEETVQTADVLIEKELLSYNETLGGATFVFRVVVEKGGATLKDTVLALDYNAPGEHVGKKYLCIEDIPVGSTVTVTEIYSGACYSLTAGCEETQTLQITAPDGEYIARFVNTYINVYRGGSGVVNNYSYKGTDGTGTENYTVTQMIGNEETKK